ncbi:hypothetical protein ACJX0J_018113, partial [Zea mays]
PHRRDDHTCTGMQVNIPVLPLLQPITKKKTLHFNFEAAQNTGNKNFNFPIHTTLHIRKATMDYKIDIFL